MKCQWFSPTATKLNIPQKKTLERTELFCLVGAFVFTENSKKRRWFYFRFPFNTWETEGQAIRDNQISCPLEESSYQEHIWSAGLMLSTHKPALDRHNDGTVCVSDGNRRLSVIFTVWHCVVLSFMFSAMKAGLALADVGLWISPWFWSTCMLGIPYSVNISFVKIYRQVDKESIFFVLRGPPYWIKMWSTVGGKRVTFLNWEKERS